MFIRPALLTATVLTLSAALAIAPAAATTSDAGLIRPDRVAVVDTPQATAAVLAVRRYVTFWYTGDARYVTEVLSPSFVDRTLLAGHVQGTQGPFDVPKASRTAVPDMRVGIEDMIVTGDHVSVHLRFCKYFTGELGCVHRQNRPTDFQASDLYHIADGKIAEDWHLEDSQTLLRRMGPQP